MIIFSACVTNLNCGYDNKNRKLFAVNAVDN